MKLPNGYGSVYKLTGNRRHPWVARITTGWKDNGQATYAYLGYFATRQEALRCLADYNSQPYDLDKRNITLGELYDMWKSSKSHTYALNTLLTYEGRKNALRQYLNIPYRKFSRATIQTIINNQEHISQQMTTRSFFVLMDRYAYELEIIPKRQTDALDKIQYSVQKEKTVFTSEEIKALWQHGTIWSDFVLIMLYSGIRISELFQIKGEDCFLGYFRCGVKTKSGKNRLIPIHHEIKDIVRKYIPDDMQEITPFSQRTFRKRFYALMDELGMKHTPHETRHTFRTAFDNTDANRTCINLIMGHASSDIGERIYTHKTIEELQEAIDKISYE